MMTYFEKLIQRPAINLLLRKNGANRMELIDLDAGEYAMDEITAAADIEEVQSIVQTYREERVLVRGTVSDVQKWQSNLVERGYTLKLINQGKKYMTFEKKQRPSDA